MTRITRTPPIERYFTAGQLGETGEENALNFDLARRYATLCETANDHVATSRWGPRQSPGTADHEHLHNAKEHLRNTDARLGRTMARGLKMVCSCGYTAEEWARKEGENRKGVGIACLRMALRELRRIWAA